ncbi:MAG TPA: class I adenylate-forming enzyme family protein [Trebonia sp.]
MTGVATGSASAADAERYRAQGWWPDQSLGELVRQRAGSDPDAAAYFAERSVVSWAEYDRAAEALAGQLAGLGLEPGDRAAVYLPDGPLVHIAYIACERAGLVIVGIPARAGDRELDHLVRKTGAKVLVCLPVYRDRTAAEMVAAARGRGVPLALHAELAGDGALTGYAWDSGQPRTLPPRSVPVAGRELGPGDLWLLNSTSGTTGVPKCVEQVQRKFMYLTRLAEAAADLSASDVFMSVVPSPFGFGLWTAHISPALIGVPCVLRERFTADETLRAVAEHRVTVLACVTTQFLMMLASPVLGEADLSSLRVLYAGGERIPPDRAREWEQRTGSTVLQFYGSNEIGPFSCTTLADDEERRLGTVGRVVPGTEYRIYDDQGRDVTASGGPGQPAGRGPGVFGGYWDDDAANTELFRPGGYLLLPDLVTVDEAGYVRIVGRKADLIIRGGKNISAASVETEVGTHPDVDLVAAIAVPDPVFGERVCVVVTLRDPERSLSLEDVRAFLTERGVGKEYFPEYLAVVEEMPQSAGGKIDKRELKTWLSARFTGHR